MKKILISHLGNQNIKIDGKTVLDFIKLDKTYGETFRVVTQKLWERYNAEKPRITINILDTLINYLLFEKKEREDLPSNDTLEKIYLFCSDQKITIRNDQDTVYEGYMLKPLLEEIYGIPVELMISECNPIDSDALTRLYKPRLLHLINSHPESSFVLCDVAGTSQQKAAVKILLEFMLPEDRYEVYNVPLKDKEKGLSGTPIKMRSIEFKSIIDQIQIERLINAACYDGAFELYVSQNKKTNTKVVNLLKFGHARYTHRRYETRKYCEPSHFAKFNHDKIKVILNYHNSSPLGLYTPLSELISAQGFFECCEYIAAAEFAIDNKDYSTFALNLYEFQRAYLSGFIAMRYQLAGFTLDLEVLGDVLMADPALKSSLAEAGLNQANNLQAQLFMANQYKERIHTEIVQFYLSHTVFFTGGSAKLEEIRNAYVIDGKAAIKKDIDESMHEFFKFLKNAFGMPMRNTYLDLNELILTLLKSD